MADLTVRRVEGFQLHDRFVLVKLTASDGSSGWGEAVATSDGSALDALERAAPLVLGRDIFHTGPLSRDLLRQGYRFGGGAHAAAASAVDIALHDLQGRVLHRPVWSLLGGRFRQRAAVYASAMRVGRTPDEEAAKVATLHAEGYTTVKLHTATVWGLEGVPDNTVATVTAVRAAVADRVRVMVDVNNAFTAADALRVGRALQELGVTHFEEPVAPWDLDGYARLATALDLDIAAGEQTHTLTGFRDLIGVGKVDVLQPNITACGGYTAGMKIAALAEAASRRIVCHNTEPTLGTVAHLHYWASVPLCDRPQEYFGEDFHPLRDETPVLAEPLAVHAGEIPIPDGPGLGVEIDEAVVRHHAQRTLTRKT